MLDVDGNKIEVGDWMFCNIRYPVLNMLGLVVSLNEGNMSNLCAVVWKSNAASWNGDLSDSVVRFVDPSNARVSMTSLIAKKKGK